MEFKSAMDRRRALWEGPWHFFRDVVIFKEINGLENLREIRFEEISIWMQCHNLPVAFMSRSILEQIGNQIGVIDEIDAGGTGTYLGRFARIRVRININHPLKKFMCAGEPKSGRHYHLVGLRKTAELLLCMW